MCEQCSPPSPEWSAERTVCHYKDLVFFVVNQFVSTYKIQSSEIPDFEQEMLLKVIKSPQSYRGNSAGMYTIIKNAAITYMDKKKRPPPVLFSEMQDYGPGLDPYEIPDYQSVSLIVQQKADFEKVLSLIEELPGPERVCITLSYGIGYPRQFSESAIARKLGGTREWVRRKLTRAEFLLKRRVNSGSLASVRSSRCQMQL